MRHQAVPRLKILEIVLNLTDTKDSAACSDEILTKCREQNILNAESALDSNLNALVEARLLVRQRSKVGAGFRLRSREHASFTRQIISELLSSKIEERKT